MSARTAAEAVASLATSMHRCAVCKKPAESQCSRCKTVYYCCKEHQREAWPTHKIQCKPPATTPNVSNTPQPTTTNNESQWAIGLSPPAQREWLVDCYRMRLDDDYVYGGGNLHGLYDPDHDASSVLQDFLIFCKLAVRNKVVPAGWDWAKFLAKAAELIPYAFEKSDAQKKYGTENVFSVAMGGRSLRYTGEAVYGSPCMMGDMTEAQDKIEDEVAEKFDGLRGGRGGILKFFQKQNGLFEEVGGGEHWKILYTSLQVHFKQQQQEWD